MSTPCQRWLATDARQATLETLLEPGDNAGEVGYLLVDGVGNLHVIPLFCLFVGQGKGRRKKTGEKPFGVSEADTKKNGVNIR